MLIRRKPAPYQVMVAREVRVGGSALREDYAIAKVTVTSASV